MGRREALLARFRSVGVERVQRMEALVLEALRAPLSEEAAETLAREAHTLKGEARMMGFLPLSELVHRAEDRIDEGAFHELLPGLDLARQLLGTDPVPAGDLADAVDAWCAVGTDDGAEEAAVHEVEPTSPRVEAPVETPAERSTPEAMPAGAEPASEAVRVDTADLTRLASSVARLQRRQRQHAAQLQLLREELRELRAQVGRAPVQPVTSIVRRLGDTGSEVALLVDELTQELKDLRYRRLDEVFGALPRLAHDVASARGRSVRVVARGGDIAVDERVLGGLREPMVHLVRNAVDHGLEDAALRVSQGKDAVGTVAIEAEPRGDVVIVTVRDDGRGIDLPAVTSRAVAERLANADEVERMSPAQQLELLFHPRLSTRDTVDDFSGRGVGLAAVRAAMAELGGHVQAVPQAVGTCFRLVVPLTTLLTQVMVCRVGEHLVALPARHVRAIRRLTPSDVRETPHGAAFTMGERLLPLADLGAVLGAGRALPAEQLPVVVVEDDARVVGLSVTEVLGTQAAVVEPLSPLARGHGPIAGACILGRGEVAWVPDLEQLVREALRRGRVPDERRARRRLLVVDDSEFTRDLLAGLLRDMGHEVVEAVNGAQGLERLLSDRPDLVFTDLDMPVMDGFGLLSAMAERGLRTPAVVISTHRAEDIVERALALGAAAYLVKAEFDDDRLARTIQRLVGP